MLRSIFCTGDCPWFLPVRLFFFHGLSWQLPHSQESASVLICFDDRCWAHELAIWRECCLKSHTLPEVGGTILNLMDYWIVVQVHIASNIAVVFACEQKQLQSCWLIAGSRWWVRYTYEQKWCSRSLHIQGISYHRGYSPDVLVPCTYWWSLLCTTWILWIYDQPTIINAKCFLRTLGEYFPKKVQPRDASSLYTDPNFFWFNSSLCWHFPNVPMFVGESLTPISVSWFRDLS